MANVKLLHHKFNINNNYTPGTTTVVKQSVWNGSEITKKKFCYQDNVMYKDNAQSYNCQAQFSNKKSNNFFSPRGSQPIPKNVINSCSSQSQKRRKNVKLLSKSSQNFQGPLTRQNNIISLKSSQQKTFMSSSIPSLPDVVSTSLQIPYAPKNEVPAGLPQTLSASRQSQQHSKQQSQQKYFGVMATEDQSHIRRLSFETSSCCCRKSIKSEGSEGSNLQYFVIKLPGMKQLVFVPRCIIDNEEQEVTCESSPINVNVVDQQPITVKLPPCESWRLLPKESLDLEKEKNDNGQLEGNDVIDDVDDVIDDVVEEYESAHAIEIQLGVLPIVKLPTTRNVIKFVQRKEVEYFNDYYQITNTSNSIEFDEFDKESPIVRLHPKQIPISRCNLPNLKIETNLKLDKDDEDRFLTSAGCSTLSTPVSEISTSFSNMSTYAESENTVFTEEEIVNETKSCSVPERRSPSVLSDFNSEHLTPVLEVEEEEESKVEFTTTSVSLEECQQEILEQEKHDINEQILNEYENEDSEYQETTNMCDSQEIKEKVEYVLPELREISENVKKLQPDSNEAIRIQRQLDTITRDNYPDSLPLSNEWTMYYADTSVTKTNTKVISKNKYSSTLNPIFKCATVPELCSNMREFSSKIKPSDMKTNVNLNFFKGNIMPMWEDEANLKGGRFTLCPPRNQLNGLWMSIVLLLAGEAIDDCNLICGAVCARRDRGDRVELWISGDAHPKAIDRIRDRLAKELGNDPAVKNVKYKKHLGKP